MKAWLILSILLCVNVCADDDRWARILPPDENDYGNDIEFDGFAFGYDGITYTAGLRFRFGPRIPSNPMPLIAYAETKRPGEAGEAGEAPVNWLRFVAVDDNIKALREAETAMLATREMNMGFLQKYFWNRNRPGRTTANIAGAIAGLALAADGAGVFELFPSEEPNPATTSVQPVTERATIIVEDGASLKLSDADQTPNLIIRKNSTAEIDLSIDSTIERNIQRDGQ